VWGGPGEAVGLAAPLESRANNRGSDFGRRDRTPIFRSRSDPVEDPASENLDLLAARMSIRTTRSMAATTFEAPRWFTEAGKLFRAKNVSSISPRKWMRMVDLAIPLRFSRTEPF
jgi:hypothetical protein